MNRVCQQCGNSLYKGSVYCSRSCRAKDFPSVKLAGQGKNRKRIRINGKREYEYRVIYAKHHGLTLGVDLTSDMIIHHIDENPFNNSIENLELLTGDAAKEHIRKHEIWKHRASGKIEKVFDDMDIYF